MALTEIFLCIAMIACGFASILICVDQIIKLWLLFSEARQKRKMKQKLEELMEAKYGKTDE